MATCNGSDPLPSYLELITGVYRFMSKEIIESYIHIRKLTPEEEKWEYFNFTLMDVLWVLLLATLFTFARYFATEYVFKPLGAAYSLTATNQKKMPESAWKFVYYLGAWSFTFYVVILSGNYRFFQKPSCVWANWDLNKPLPIDIYLMYIIQSGFYTHSLYATVCLDTWRKDSVVMMIHHILTLALIGTSYTLRYQNIGSVVLFLHDMCDIQLEFTKLNVYFKIQNGKLVRKHEIMANITFFCFSLTWFISRLYWYPLKVLYSATSVVYMQKLILPGAIVMNVLLWILQTLNIYWFLFILSFLLRVATGQIKEVDDTREYDVEEKFSRKLSAKLESVSETLSDESVIKKVAHTFDGIVANGENADQNNHGKEKLKKEN